MWKWVGLILRLLMLMALAASSSLAAIHHTNKNIVAWRVNALSRGGAGASSSALAATSSTVGSLLGSFVQTIQDARRDLAAAAVARCTSIFLMYPVDTFKTRIQMEQTNPFRMGGIYKGVAGSLFGQVPYGVLTFGSYETYKRAFLARFPNVKPIFLYAWAAVLGDLTGSGWLCPSEVVKQQMQAGMYASTREAVAGIWKKKGLVGFYEGYFGGVSRDVPFRVAQLTTYEVTKNLYLRIKARKQAKTAATKKKTKASKSGEEELALTPIEAAICGAVCGSVSAAVTSPLDRIKTLLMTDSQAYGGTVWSCTAKIWQQEGLKGFTVGVLPRVTYIAPSVAIFFIAYEQVQQRLGHWTTPPTTSTNKSKK